MSKETAGAGEKFLLLGRNVSLLGALGLATTTLLPGSQVFAAGMATNFLMAGVGFEATRQILKTTSQRLGKTALAR